MVRGYTHKGAKVYLCDQCETPLVRTWRGYRATDAAKAALRDGTDEVLEFECDLYRGVRTSSNLLPVLGSDGKIRLAEADEERLESLNDAEAKRLFSAHAAALLLGSRHNSDYTREWLQERQQEILRGDLTEELAARIPELEGSRTKRA